MGGDEVAINTAEAASALRWWLESGVDAIAQEQPRDWLEPAPAKPPPQSQPQLQPQSQSQPPPAQSGAASAPPPPDLDSFRAWLTSGPDAPLAAMGSKAVHPQGAEAAQLMIIAEPPSREDAASNRPIGGEAWDLTQRMLAAIGLATSETYFANLACFYSPGARLSAEQLDQCAAAARQHIAMVKPGRLLLLGEAPARALLGKPLTEARGHVHIVDGINAVATFHPRFLFDRPAEKARAWADLLLLMEEN